MIDYVKKYTDEVALLPNYCLLYFTELDAREFQISSKYVYAMDLKVFFEWVKDRNNLSKAADVTKEMLEALTSDDINLFILYLTMYEYNGTIHTNSAYGKHRKIASLRSFFKFAYKKNWISHDVMQLVDLGKRPDHDIIVLSEEEQRKMIESAETGNLKEKRASKFHDKICKRDIAILTLFLGTGIRVSELVGINESDLSLDENKVSVTRKGGKTEFVFFGDEVKATLLSYIDEERPHLLGYSSANDVPFDLPLFISLKKQRISVRMVQEIIGGYAKAVAGNMKITPHTLRKTYGSQLYYRYRDVYLTQKALGHTNVQTTIKYYTKFDKDRLEKMKEYNPTDLH